MALAADCLRSGSERECTGLKLLFLERPQTWSRAFVPLGSVLELILQQLHLFTGKVQLIDWQPSHYDIVPSGMMVVGTFQWNQVMSGYENVVVQQ